ncbi:MAG: helix-hairpin-helix domain-containing protein [Pirellulales bacterium]|nr:helix-hairpin-helix domain-containing protein [Pirellulales bacterium]
MASPQDDQRKPFPTWLLRRADQVTVAVLVGFGLVGMVAWWAVQGGLGGRLIECEKDVPCPAAFQVDLNRAEWPELAQLPEIGETLARRIVESRDESGPFVDIEDLSRVRGIGPKTLERLRPHLLPLPPRENIAGAPPESPDS